mmetsp:Transcript_60154/g.107355  ORF Transcript_60154/g.107355 Transcript_60154/m.107355 type:complete len:223 (-) Transcript_60154:11-679(-)
MNIQLHPLELVDVTTMHRERARDHGEWAVALDVRRQSVHCDLGLAVLGALHRSLGAIDFVILQVAARDHLPTVLALERLVRTGLQVVRHLLPVHVGRCAAVVGAFDRLIVAGVLMLDEVDPLPRPGAPMRPVITPDLQFRHHAGRLVRLLHVLWGQMPAAQWALLFVFQTLQDARLTELMLARGHDRVHQDPLPNGADVLLVHIAHKELLVAAHVARPSGKT